MSEPAMTQARAWRSDGVMYTPSWPSFHRPMTGTSTRPLIAEMSDRPWQRMAAAPPISAARAICAIVSGWRMGSPGYAWTETMSLPFREAISGCMVNS